MNSSSGAHREKSARVAVVGPPPGDASSGDEEDEEEAQGEIEDSQILEDLPDETEVRLLACRELSVYDIGY